MSDEINKVVPDPADVEPARAAAEELAEVKEEVAAAEEEIAEVKEEVAAAAEEIAEVKEEIAGAETAEETAAAEQAALNDELEHLRDTFQSELDKAAEEAKAAEEMQPVIQELEEGPDPDEEEDEDADDAGTEETGEVKKTKKKKKSGKKRPVGLIVALVLVCVLIVAPLAGYFVLSVKEPNTNAFVAAYAAAEAAKDPAEQRSKYAEALSYCTEGSLFEGLKQQLTEKAVVATCKSDGYAAANSYMQSNMDEEMRANPKTRAFKDFLAIPEKLTPVFDALPEKLPAEIEAAGGADKVDYEALAGKMDVPALARSEVADLMQKLGEAVGAADAAQDDDAYYAAMRDYLTAYQSVSSMSVTAQKIPEDILLRLYGRGYAYEASMVADQIFTEEMRAAVENEAVKKAFDELAALKDADVDLWAFAEKQRQTGKTAEADLIAALDASLPENGKKSLARYAGELILALDAEADANLTLSRRHLANVVSAEDALGMPVTDTAIRLCRVLLNSGDVNNAYSYMMRYVLPTDAAGGEGEENAEAQTDTTAQAEAALFAAHPDFEADYNEIAALYNAQSEAEEIFSQAYYAASYGGGSFDAAATKEALAALKLSSAEKYAGAYADYYTYVCEIYGDMNRENMLASVLAAEKAFGAHRVICLADKAQIYLSLGQPDAAFTAALDMLSVDSGSDLANALMAKQQRMESSVEGAMEYAQRGIDAGGEGAAASCEEEAAIVELLQEKYADAYARVKALYDAARSNGSLTVENVELAMVIANRFKSADETEQAEIDAFAKELSDLLSQAGREVSANTQAILDGTKQPGDVYFGAAVGEKAE